MLYPASRKSEHSDNYHGTMVADPYRWLEDDRSAETEDWVREQNAVTHRFLDGIPFRDALRERLTALANYPRLSPPVVRGRWRWFAKNDGLQNQSVYYVQDGDDGAPRVLLDPNAMSADGTTRVASLTFDRTGSRIAYMISAAGSDWQEIRVLDTATGAEHPDVVHWVKVSSIAWWGDGFFYSRYPAPVETTSALSSVNQDHQVYYHVMGTAQTADRLMYRNAAHPQRFHTVSTTEDERFAILYVSDRGNGKDGTAISVMNLSLPDATFAPVWSDFDDEMLVVDNVDDSLLVLTNRGAPNRRLVRIALDDTAEAHWNTVIAECAEPLEAVTTAGGRLFATYFKDVASRVQVLDLCGEPECDVALPGLGTAVGFDGARDATAVYYSYTDFATPPTPFRYDITARHSHRLHETALPFDPALFHTQQVFVPSADGTRIPAFIVARRGLALTGNHPTLLYGYGGFNVSLLPAFSALRIAFLEQGGVYVQANLRGGAEYGEAWHRAGMKAQKQQVFDDGIAVAEWLIANGYTCSERLAIQGGSNGGLLVGAIMTQRPELARVALPQVGVLDMLRFHQFTIGWNWIADYGSSDEPEGFQYLRAYSPLHNLHDGVDYPATLITTGDHDDRVVPAHSFKFAARLQEAHGGTTPVLIRVETQSGHGSSSLTKSLAETADVYAFLFHQFGVTPVFPAKQALAVTSG